MVRKHKVMKKALAFTLAFSMVSSLIPGALMNGSVVKAATTTDVNGKTKILEFDFEGADALKGKAYNGSAMADATATAAGVTFEDGVAVFPNDGGVQTTGITYKPGANDPMKKLSGTNATVSMWVKSGQTAFSSTLFAYGARQDGEATKELGSSVQILGRNNQNPTYGLTYYRNNRGQSEKQTVEPNKGEESPYILDEWQLVTLVEASESLTLYIDGEVVGANIDKNVVTKHLNGYAADNYQDEYYFGFLPYASPGDSHFVGAMDSVTVYNGALTQAEVQTLYERGKLQYAIDKAKTYTQSDYTPDSWTALSTALTEANTAVGNKDANATDLKDARTKLEQAMAGLKLSDLPKAVLRFDFTGTADTTALNGTALINGQPTPVKATASNVTFDGTSAVFADATDAANAAAVQHSGITFTPEAGKDPLAGLKDSTGKSTGATVTMWVKSDKSIFSSSLFAYGAKQTLATNGGKEAEVGKLGASVQIMARNGAGADEGVVYYRNEVGSTGFDVNGKRQYHKIEQEPDLTPYKKDTWQIVTYVEEKDGNGTLYIDGVKIGTTPAAKHSLFEYATDAYGGDSYYIGYLPYTVDEDTRFSGAIGGLTIYGEPLSEERVQRLYEEGQLTQVLAVAKTYYDNETNKNLAGWSAFKEAYEAANKTSMSSQDGLAIPAETLVKLRTDLSNALAELRKSETDANKPILEFDFDAPATEGTVTETGTDDEGNPTTMEKKVWRIAGTTSVSSIGEVKATVDKEIEIEDGLAKFPRETDGTVAPNIGITYKPTEGKDPMDALKEGSGATVSMWIRTNESVFSSTLFGYGALRKNGELGASTQLLARNNKNDTNAVTYGRDANGSSGSGKNRQRVVPANKTPYKQGHWQLVTYVEEIDGTVKMYVDGVSLGEVKINTPRTLGSYAKDEYDDDRYYIGFLPYVVLGDTRFVGDMDNFAIYGHAFSQEEILAQYYDGQLAYAVKEAEKYATKKDTGYVAGTNVQAGDERDAFVAALNAVNAPAAGKTSKELLETLIAAQDALVLTDGGKTVRQAAKESLDARVKEAAAITNTADIGEEILEEYEAILAAAEVALESTELTSGDLTKLEVALTEVLGYMDPDKVQPSASGDPILKFDFEEKVDADGKVTGVVRTGVTSGDITATSKNITFENGVAIFPDDNANIATGISYTVEAGNDPMKALVKDGGASIAMWVKTTGGDFGRDLFTYGALQETGETKGQLGASIEILAKNNSPHKDPDYAVYYRNDAGKTKNDKTDGKSQKLKQTSETPYNEGTWQLVVYVEDANGNGTGTLYIDGVEVGRNEVAGHTLYDYVNNGKVNSYYIGCLPYKSNNGDHFVGSMDEVAIYDTALTSAQVVDIYKKYKETQLTSAKNALEEALGNAEIKDAYANPDDYTEATWEDFSDAYKNAERLLDAADASADEVEKAVDTVQKAYEALVPARVEAQEELQKFIEELNYSQSDYVDGWEEYADALEDAKEAAKDTNTTISAADVKAAQTALEEAIENLVTKEYQTAKDALDTAVEEAKKLNAADYAEGWSDFKSKLDEAESLNNSASHKTTDPEALTAATNALKTAQGKLRTNVEVAKDALGKVIDEAKVLVEANYTPDKWPAFKEALDNAQAVYANSSATAKEFTDAKTALTTAMDALMSNAQAAFRKAVADAQLLQEADYTEESWSTFIAARAAAEGKLTAKLTDEEWKAETEALTKAQAALVPKLRIELEQIIEAEKQKNYVKANYTEESWAAYTAALKEAEEKKDTASVADLKLLKANLEGAKLITRQEDAWMQLSAAIEDAGKLVQTDYTEDSWAEFDKALTAAKAATDQNGLDELKTLKANLDEAKTNLVMTQAAALKALDDAVSAADAMKYNKEDYEATSWDTYEKALNAAKARDDKAEASVLTGLREALAEAQRGLVTKAVAEAKDALNKVINDLEEKAYSKDDYEETSWNAYELALKNATDIPEGATAEDIKALQTALEEAATALVTKEYADAVDKLNTAIEAADKKNEADYTPESWTGFKAALDAAKSPADGATPEDIAKLQKDLEDASAALVSKTVKAAKDALAAAVNVAAALKQADYTPESWAAFQAALNAAKAPATNATEEQLKKLKSELESAMAKLKKSEKSSEVEMTAEEKDIASKYGVSAEVAKLIVEIIKKYNISSDVSALTEKYVTSIKNDKDVKGSAFGLLQARAIKQTGNSVKLKWNKVSDADGYLVYGAKCGDTYKLLATTSKTSYTQKKLKKGTYYKYLVLAYKDAGGAKVTMAAAKTVHTVTTGGNFGVAKKVDAPAKVTVKVKKTFKLKAKEIKDKLKIKSHRKIKYESSNTAIATVSGSGKIKAKKKGTCYVYAYAQNGIFKKIKVTVK